MRIIYILNATDMYGGATKAVMNLLEGEVAKSIQPLFILPSDTGIAHTLRQKGIPYEVLTYRMSVYPPLRCAKDILLFIPRLVGRIFVNWTAAKQLYSIAKEFKADIIHTNTMCGIYANMPIWILICTTFLRKLVSSKNSKKTNHIQYV